MPSVDSSPVTSAARLPAGDAPVRLLYVIGSGRSGSTLLGRLLGRHSAILYTGEVYNYGHFIATAPTRPRTCSCGEALLDCPFWQRVRAHLAPLETEGPLDLKERSPEVFEARNYALFDALRHISDASVLVDASKRFYRAERLLASPKFEVTLVHLVRDPRAYGFAHYRTRDITGDRPSVYFTRQFRWLRNNLALWLRYHRRPEYSLVRYEELAQAPEVVVTRLLTQMGLDFEEAQLALEPYPFHDFSGNKRTRFTPKKIQLDLRYLDGTKGWRWWLATLLVVPGLLLFGYPFRQPSRS